MGCGSSTHRAWRPRAPDVQVFNDPVPSPKVSPTAKVTLVRKGCDIDFSRVMASKEGINALLEFARSEMSDENLRFWIDATRWRDEVQGLEASPAVEDADARSRAKALVEEFLRPGATFAVNLPSKVLKHFVDEVEDFRVDTFDEAIREANILIQRDTFERFTMSDAAQPLLVAHPELALREMEGAAVAAQKALQQSLQTLASRVGCERATVWVKGNNDSKIYAVCSSELGNAIIALEVGEGMAGGAAASGEDVISNEAQHDERRAENADKATNFVTLSLLCVALKADDGSSEAVVQLINKRAANGAGQFSPADATIVREDFGAEILTASISTELRGLLPS